MKLLSKLSALAMMTAATAVPLAVVAPQAAHADRCEPTELVLRAVFGPDYEEQIISEQDSPTCYVLINYVYPRLCDDQTTLNNCLGTVNPKPFTPVEVAPYNPPIVNTVYCGVVDGVSNTVGAGRACQPLPLP